MPYRPLALLSAALALSVVAPAQCFGTTRYSVGTCPEDLAIRDVDGDGDLDIVVVDSASSDSRAFLNDGTGALSAEPPVSLVIAPRLVALGNFDAVPGVDAFYLESQTAVVLSDFRGASPSTATYTFTLTNAEDVEVVTQNPNPIDDIQITHRGDELFSTGSGYSLILDGSGPLETPTPGFHARETVTADLNFDGFEDTVQLGKQGGVDVVRILQGTASGPQPTPAITQALGGTPGASRGLTILEGTPDNPHLISVALNDIAPLTGSEVRSFDLPVSSGQQIATTSLIPAGDLSTTAPFTLTVVARDFDRSRITATSGTVLQRGDDILAVHQDSAVLHVDVEGGTASATETVSTGTTYTKSHAADLDGNGYPDLIGLDKANGELVVHLSVARALATRFGTGGAGTTGVPSIDGDPPRRGQPAQVRLSNARPYSPAVLLVSGGAEPTPLTPSFDLLVDPGHAKFCALNTFTNGLGEASAGTSEVPNDPAIDGDEFIFQWAIVDPLGVFGGIVAFSEALRWKVGGC